jgi:hypothetical protein
MPQRFDSTDGIDALVGGGVSVSAPCNDVNIVNHSKLGLLQT